jgi:hypothetical protein
LIPSEKKSSRRKELGLWHPGSWIERRILYVPVTYLPEFEIIENRRLHKI